ncbi:MAG: tRNA (guanosine(46)-N7)-methyltransferase TrmB [Catenisphaera adipataccumulans]|jgi:tRNA (guanine-N7-)-methyltransferase|uniref:tRNA (guanosine(46)-N7)-methyltransferase TrmB n=1 Tax=Catenisphaera adipataccumulans TaxID=700500 RepID=UPI003D93949A
MRRIKWAVEYLPTSSSLIKEPEQLKGKWKEFLQTDRLHLEIGCGKGGYSAAMASLYPEEGFIALEYNESAAGVAAKKFDEIKGHKPVLLWKNAAYVTDWFGENEVDVIHLNFSDPWPKHRTAKRRLSSPRFLEQYKSILAPNGEVQMKTDNEDLFAYSLLAFQDAGFRMDDVTLNFRKEPHDEDPMTEYEAKFVAQGHPIYRCVWKRNK